MFKKMFGSKDKSDQADKEIEARQQRIASAQQGIFNGWAVQTAQEINGAHCLIYSNQAFTLRLDEEGLHFSDLVFFRSAASAHIGGSMQGANLVSAITTVATTETVALHIPWAEIFQCLENPMPDFRIQIEKQMDTGSRYRILCFTNHLKERKEWIGFGISPAQDDEIQEMFTAHLKTHQIPIENYNQYIKVKSSNNEAGVDDFSGGECGLCQKPINGQAISYPAYVAAIASPPIRIKAMGLLCGQCKTVYCFSAHRKEMSFTFFGGIEKAVCPRCGASFISGRVVVAKK